MPKIEELKKLIEDTSEIINEEFMDWRPLLDSANFQTKSKEDFEHFKSVFEGEGLLLKHELGHAGRRIAVYTVPEDAKTSLPGLNYIELSEPKPHRDLKDNAWEYVSYLIENFDDLINHHTVAEKKLEKVRVIGRDKFCYYINGDIKIQFRNSSISTAKEIKFSDAAPQAQAVDSTSNLNEDLKKEKELRLRLMADFDNYRRVTENQIQKVIQTANIDLVKHLIEIQDDLERSVGNLGDEGVKGIHDKLKSLLNDHGYEEIYVAVGDKFDPHSMQALTTIPTPDEKMDNTVQELMQKGYMHKPTNTIVRMAKVVVAKHQ